MLKIINESEENFIFLLDNIDKLLQEKEVAKFLGELLEKCPNL